MAAYAPVRLSARSATGRIEGAVLLSTTLLFDMAEHETIPLAVQQIRRAFPDALVVMGGLMLSFA